MPSILLRNVRVFDGVRPRLTPAKDVTVDDGVITRIAAAKKTPTTDPASPAADVEIDGAGRTLMPGLIDMHTHLSFANVTQIVALTADLHFLAILAARGAEDALLRGFTSVRDMGGPVFGLKQAIDAGLTRGPRIYPSGAFISQTGGHGDFRLPYELPRGSHGQLTHTELVGATVIADGVPEVLRGTREQLMLGASQIKVMSGGGIASHYDPLDVTQYTEPEIRAAVDAAENWGTYVTVHAYTSRAVQQALRAGVRCIEHGHLVDDRTVAQMTKQGVWWSLQAFIDDEDSSHAQGANRVKQLQMYAGTDTAFKLARKHGTNVAFGTDVLFGPDLWRRQTHRLTKMVRWMSAGEALVMATSRNAELLALSGPRNPYPGKLGVVAKDALADLLLIDGNPLQDIDILTVPEKMPVIIKNGTIVKNAT
ncbi:amidohydrolase family protein [Branchiibius sp. NY16-3462-2]|uniref:metal-dependent hydrolase family protein n=1 Tax=Branchiibius sp. NY16-3462-2 TaxID=1807500 RepID=UPI00079872AE|nr:amidohydrolase family protein [Branchiibius sp. NY16-3462-2]KYH43475.1 hydrolase [Branchiibius sp. NY16-3462-2]